MTASQGLERLSYEIFALGPGGARSPIARGTREYLANQASRVEERTDGVGLVFWFKSLDLSEGFGIGAYISHEGPLDGFGLFVTHRDWRDGFSLEWFDRDREDEYEKLQGPELGRVRDSEEPRAVEFLTDVTLRFMDDIRTRQTGERTHEVIVGSGSVLRIAAQQ